MSAEREKKDASDLPPASSLPPHVRWQKGGEAWFLDASGDAVVLLSSTPSPPGSRIDGRLEGDSASVKIKIHASRKQESGLFRLEGRPLDLTREIRERIVELAASARPERASAEKSSS